MLLETGQNTISGNHQLLTTTLSRLSSTALPSKSSKGIYKDPIHAIVRESCANAHDAHVCANNPEPFFLYPEAPTSFEPTFPSVTMEPASSRPNQSNLFSTSAVINATPTTSLVVKA